MSQDIASPRPWRLDGVLIRGANHDVLGYRPSDKRSARQQIANVKLIIRAVNAHDDMLAALKAARAEFYPSVSLQEDKILATIDAAVGKATGS